MQGLGRLLADMTTQESSNGRWLRDLPPASLLKIYWLTVLLLLASYLWRCGHLGLGFPMPWPDEGSFLWQALAVQHHNTLFSPELNPERRLMWMPPGYMITQGLLFKLTGFSLEWARTLSSLYVAGGAALLAAIFWRFKHPFLNLLFTGIFLHSPIMLLVGNVARMEGLLFLFACAGLLLLQRGRLYLALATIALLPLIHPNGACFTLGAGVYFLALLRKDWRKHLPSRADLTVASLAASIWLLYAFYIGLHWDAFLADMRFQLQWKAVLSHISGAPWQRLSQEPSLLLAGIPILGGFILLLSGRGTPASLLLIYAVPLYALGATVVGWPYELYPALASLFAFILLLEGATRLANARLRPRAGAHLVALPLACAFLIASVQAWALHTDTLLRDSVDRSTVPLALKYGVPFLEDRDEIIMREYLRSLEAEGPVTVIFFPWAEALLYADMRSDKLRFVQPTLHTFHADVQIIHHSRFIPESVRTRLMARVRKSQGVRVPLQQWSRLHRRDGTETWFAHRRHSAVPAPTPSPSRQAGGDTP